MAVFGFFGPNLDHEKALETLSSPFPPQLHSQRSDSMNYSCTLATTQDAWSNCLVAYQDNLIAICGDISNRKQLLDGLSYAQSSPDTELVMELFRRYGSDLFSHIEGLHCGAIWNKAAEILTIKTDRIGGCFGFYYTVHDNCFYFSNRLPSLIGLNGISRKLSQQGLVELFSTGYVLPPGSLIEGIYKTWPGQEISWDGVQCKTKTTCVKEAQTPQHEAPVRSLEQLLDRFVEPIANDPSTGWLLSGGIDSSVLVALASRHATTPLRTFSAIFPGSHLNEEASAKTVAEHTGSKSHFFDLGSRDEFEALPRITWEMDEPFLDFSAIPSFALFKRLKPHASALVSGDGPDHLLGRHYPLAAKCRLRNFASLFQLSARLTGSPYLKMVTEVTSSNLHEAYKTLFTFPTWNDNPRSYKDLLSPLLRSTEPRPLTGVGLDLQNSGAYEDLLKKSSIST